jgi:hypothetical protein
MVFFHFETPSVMATLGASEGSEREAREWREREKDEARARQKERQKNNIHTYIHTERERERASERERARAREYIVHHFCQEMTMTSGPCRLVLVFFSLHE